MPQMNVPPANHGCTEDINKRNGNNNNNSYPINLQYSQNKIPW